MAVMLVRSTSPSAASPLPFTVIFTVGSHQPRSNRICGQEGGKGQSITRDTARAGRPNAGSHSTTDLCHALRLADVALDDHSPRRLPVLEPPDDAMKPKLTENRSQSRKDARGKKLGANASANATARVQNRKFKEIFSNFFPLNDKARRYFSHTSPEEIIGKLSDGHFKVQIAILLYFFFDDVKRLRETREIREVFQVFVCRL